MTRWRDLSQAGLFGLIDGLNGMVGLVIGLSRAHAAAAVILTAILARAGSSAVSMAGAQYESEDVPADRQRVYAQQREIGLRTAAEIRAAEDRVSDEELDRFRERFARAVEGRWQPVVLPSPEVRPVVSARLRWLRIAAMGGGYLTSALVPGLGFLISFRAGWAFFVPATIAVLAGVTWFRSGAVGWLRAAVTTLVIFALAVGAGLLAALAA